MSILNIFNSKESKNYNSPTYPIYDIKINSLQGKPIQLSDFKGKHILFVNVASKCGFTSQYKELQDLYNTYKSKLVVIGVPCNQFGSQEPGTSILVPAFTLLTNKELNDCKSSTVKWNFQKYLIDPKGMLVDYFYSTTKPLSKKITKHL